MLTVACVTQTTLSQDDISVVRQTLLHRFPNLKGSESNVCPATQNRQDAVKKLAVIAGVLLVVGSSNSSNSNRLREVGARQGIQGYLIDDESDIEISWLEGKQRVAITAGASAPERLVESVIDWLRKHGWESVREMEGQEEKVHFAPADLL